MKSILLVLMLAVSGCSNPAVEVAPSEWVAVTSNGDTVAYVIADKATLLAKVASLRDSLQQCRWAAAQMAQVDR